MRFLYCSITEPVSYTHLKIMEKTGNVVGVKAVNEENEVMMITTEGIIIRICCEDISILRRITSGVKLMNLDENITVASIAKVRE